MPKYFQIIQVITSVLLVTVILMQSRGAGLSGVFGGGSTGAVKSTRRGPEKIIFRATVVLSIIFLGLSLAGVLLK